MLDVITALEHIYALTKLIYDQVQLVKSNAGHCRHLIERIKTIEAILHGLDKIENNHHYKQSLNDLLSTLQASLDFIHKFSTRHRFYRFFLKAEKYQGRFNELEGRLNESILQLNLGLSAQQLLNHEEDKKDQAKDMRRIINLLKKRVRLNENAIFERDSESISEPESVFKNEHNPHDRVMLFSPSYRMKNQQPNNVSQFLKLVTEGSQGHAEVLLKKNPGLALQSSDVTDLSGRLFQGITGFQYAVWALDSHMWTMIKKYLPDEVVPVQLQGMTTGSWIVRHNASGSWQTLIDALEKYQWTKKHEHWQKVGSEQRLLPAHVVNEYALYGGSEESEGSEWYTAFEDDKNGAFAYLMIKDSAGALFYYKWDGSILSREMQGEVSSAIAFDIQFCRDLLASRLKQHDQLFAEFSREQNDFFVPRKRTMA